MNISVSRSNLKEVKESYFTISMRRLLWLGAMILKRRNAQNDNRESDPDAATHITPAAQPLPLSILVGCYHLLPIKREEPNRPDTQLLPDVGTKRKSPADQKQRTDIGDERVRVQKFATET